MRAHATTLTRFHFPRPFVFHLSPQGPECTDYTSLTSQAKVSKSVARPKSTLRYALTLTNPAAKGGEAVPLDVSVTLPPHTTYKAARVAPAVKPKQTPTQTAEVDGSTVLTWSNVPVKAGGKRTIFVTFKVAADAPNGQALTVAAGYTRAAGPDAPYCATQVADTTVSSELNKCNACTDLI